MVLRKESLPIWWEEIEPYEINHALWGSTYQPKVWAKLCYIKEDALYLNMFVEELNPKATYTNPNDPVYKDSCLEFFINVNPNHNDNYLNFEMNANGAMLVGIGSGREHRKPLDVDFSPFVFKNDEGWGVTLIIPESFLLEHFASISDEWKGNFYKCGDETESTHFLSWSEVKEEKPNFHCPQWFGTI